MALNWISSRAVLALPLIAIVLALANWNARPEAAWPWAAPIVVGVVMIAVWLGARLAFRGSSGDAASVRNFASVTHGVAVGALTMIIALALTLAHAYGVVGDPDRVVIRTTMVIMGAYLVVTGNAMPRMLPTVSSMQGDGARIQAFQRLAGWTCVLCGLGFAAAWLALPIDAAVLVSMALVAATTIVIIMRLLRLRKPRHHVPGLN